MIAAQLHVFALLSLLSLLPAAGVQPVSGVRPLSAFQLDFSWSATPTPQPPVLEEAAFIHRRQYPQLYPPETLLPDLRSLRPADFKIVLDVRGRRRFLHFSTAFWNRGPGVLELVGREQGGDPLLQVTQQVYRADGSLEDVPAGFFEYEGDHGHWHWENFSRYELWTVSEHGLDILAAANDKVGFCLRDVRVYRGDPQHVRLPAGQSAVGELAYDSCFWEKQGLSVGWLDIYRANLPGQFVEITGLPDGLYALKTIIDPADTIWETDEENNSAFRYLMLEGTRVRVLQEDYQPEFRSTDYQ